MGVSWCVHDFTIDVCVCGYPICSNGLQCRRDPSDGGRG